MSTEAQWDATRWRDGSETPRYETMQQHPQLSAMPTPQSGLKDSSSQAWYGTSQDQSQAYAYNSRGPSQAYGNHLSQYASAEQSKPSGNHESSRQTTLPQNAGYPGPWRSGPLQDPSVDKRGSDISLSLQIPNSASGMYSDLSVTPKTK